MRCITEEIRTTVSVVGFPFRIHLLAPCVCSVRVTVQFVPFSALNLHKWEHCRQPSGLSLDLQFDFDQSFLVACFDIVADVARSTDDPWMASEAKTNGTDDRRLPKRRVTTVSRIGMIQSKNTRCHSVQ